MDKTLELKDDLDEMEKKLIIGIIQPPPKDKKRYDKMSREELRRKRMGDNYSDEYDDEEPDSFEIEMGTDGTLDALRKTRNNQIVSS